MESCEVESYIRGYQYHEYMDVWEPKIEEEYELKWEPENIKDLNAVAIVIPTNSTRCGRPQPKELSYASGICNHPNTVDGSVKVVGHIPQNMASCVSKFLKRASNSGKVIVKGKRINRGAGFGLEIPCVYKFSGDPFSQSWLKVKINKSGYKLLTDKQYYLYLKHVTFFAKILNVQGEFKVCSKIV